MDIEQLAEKFHEIYQEEAHRQGDIRHQEWYEDLPDNIKEFDRVLARYVNELFTKDRDTLQARAEKLEIQLAGCATAAQGWNAEPAKPLDYGWSPAYQDVLDLRRRHDALLKRQEGHNQTCHYCGKPCNSVAGDPSQWPIPLIHPNEAGVVKWHHMGCALSRLATVDVLQEQVRSLREALSWLMSAFNDELEVREEHQDQFSVGWEKAERALAATEPKGEAVRGPAIVCLCGSTRFKDAFDEANYRETMAGKIVLSVGFFVHATGNRHGQDIGATPEQKVALDELHKRKIDLADEVLVLNIGGYIGDSTRSEINYATAHGKHIRFAEPKE